MGKIKRKSKSMTTTTKSLKQRDAEHTPEFYNPRRQSIFNWKAFYSFMISKGTVKSKRIMEQKEGEWCPKQKKTFTKAFSGDKREEKLYCGYEKPKRI